MKNIQGLFNKVTTPEQRKQLKAAIRAGGKQAQDAYKQISQLIHMPLNLTKTFVQTILPERESNTISKPTAVESARANVTTQIRKIANDPMFKGLTTVAAFTPVGAGRAAVTNAPKLTKGAQGLPEVAKYVTTRIPKVKANTNAAQLINRYNSLITEQISNSRQAVLRHYTGAIDKVEHRLNRLAEELSKQAESKSNLKLPDIAGRDINANMRELLDDVNQISNPEVKKAFEDIMKEDLVSGANPEKLSQAVKASLEKLNALKAKVNPNGLTYASDFFEGEKEVILHKVTNGQKLNASEEATFVKELKENSERIKQAFDSLGIKSKAEMSDGLEFIKQFGKILENSPKNIKGKAFKKVATLQGNFKIQNPGDIEGLLADTGLSPKDIFTLWKNNKKTFIGGLFAAGIGSLVLGGLGYLDKGPLARKARKDAGLEDLPFDVSGMTDQEKAEVKANLRDPRLSELTSDGIVQGISGKKYHIYNDSIYDFNTGKKVDITQALEDVSAFEDNRLAQAQQQIAKNNETLRQLQMQQEAGYNVAPQMQQIQSQNEGLQQQINQSQNTLGGIKNVTDVYSDDEDVSEQYYRREIEPQINNQQLQRQQQQAMMNQMYADAFNKIAQSTYQDLDRFYTPEALSMQYMQHQMEAAEGKHGFMTPQQYADAMKMNAMRELAPQIREKAYSGLDSMMKYYYEGQKLEQEYSKQAETKRHNIAGEQTDIYRADTERQKAGETQRHNISEEGLKAQSNQTNAFEAITGRMNAETAQKEYERKRQLLPYQQAEALGGFFGNMSMSDVNPAQVMQDNPELFGSVLPNAGQQNQNKQTPQQRSTGLFDKLKGQQ